MPTGSESAVTAWSNSALAWLGGDFDFDEGDGGAALSLSMLPAELLTSEPLQFLYIIPKSCSAFESRTASGARRSALMFSSRRHVLSQWNEKEANGIRDMTETYGE